VRQQWVGLVLLLARYLGPQTYLGFGVLSGPATWLGQMWGIVLGRVERVTGYAVEGSRAVDILQASSPEAAAWWRENAAEHVAPQRYLIFHEHVCQIVDT
jgi:hypothetical protein